MLVLSYAHPIDALVEIDRERGLELIFSGHLWLHPEPERTGSRVAHHEPWQQRFMAEVEGDYVYPTLLAAQSDSGEMLELRPTDDCERLLARSQRFYFEDSNGQLVVSDKRRRELTRRPSASNWLEDEDDVWFRDPDGGRLRSLLVGPASFFGRFSEVPAGPRSRLSPLAARALATALA